ncbi:MAG: hypothetical protein JRN15_12515, partial [Nitrososphaerota archaeon]|nr:hypothetical protein [Nitrososphaerota archaeon]
IFACERSLIENPFQENVRAYAFACIGSRSLCQLLLARFNCRIDVPPLKDIARFKGYIPNELIERMPNYMNTRPRHAPEYMHVEEDTTNINQLMSDISDIVSHLDRQNNKKCIIHPVFMWALIIVFEMAMFSLLIYLTLQFPSQK